MGNEFGLHFPIILDNQDYGSIPPGVPAYGSPAKPGLEDSIKSSLRILLSWQVNDRNFATPFGSILETLLGSPNALSILGVVETFIILAIERWETRITVQDVTITQDNEYLVIQISGLINQTQSEFNYSMVI